MDVPSIPVATPSTPANNSNDNLTNSSTPTSQSEPEGGKFITVPGSIRADGIVILVQLLR